MELQIGSIISTARRQKGFTQEALASLVGVSAAAVSKWETGASYPDITLLAPVARALSLTVDQLLSFHAQPTAEELDRLYQCLSEVFQRSGYAAGQAACEQALHDYPRCGALKLRIGGLYQRFLLLPLTDMDTTQGEAYAQEIWTSILSLFEQAETETDDAGEKLSARFMRACVLLQLNRTDEAKCLLDSFPRQLANPEQLYPTLYLARGEVEKAERYAEQRLLTHATACFTCIVSLCGIARKRNDRERARRLSALAATLDDAFSLRQPNTILLCLQTALADSQVDAALALAEQYLTLMEHPMPDYINHPLFSSMDSRTLSAAELVALRQSSLRMLAQDPECSLLHGLPAFEALLERFRQRFAC